MSDAPLVIDGAVKRFGNVQALAGASFELRRGELLGLLGPNGAGKTTLIKAIAGRSRLDAGRIQLFGRPLAPQDPRPQIGVVPQELAIYPKLTASENLEVFGRLNGVSRAAIKDRVRWALQWSDLTERAGEPVRGYSGGMRRRLNIACSLVHEPTVVLLDEPTVGVDPQSRERIYEMLRSLQEGGVSILLTTHHLEEAEQRCDRIVIIDHGAIVASGTVRELIDGDPHAARAATITFVHPLPVERTAITSSLTGALPATATFDEDRKTLRTPIADIAVDLPPVLEALARAGATIADVRFETRSLQDVFISLTGRELRE